MSVKIFIIIVSLVLEIRLCFCSPLSNSRNYSTYPMDSLNLVTILDHKYYFSNFNVTWFDALTFCEKYGMELVKVDTYQENIDIKNHIQSLTYASGNFGFYTSGNRMGHGDTFLWGDGSDINWSIQEWCEGNPSDCCNVTENCLEYQYDLLCWNNIACDAYIAPSTTYPRGRFFICEEIVD